MSSNIFKTKLLKDFESNPDIHAIIEKMDINFNETQYVNVKRKLNKLNLDNKPRYLTDDELNGIVSRLPKLPCIIERVSEFNLEQIQAKIKAQLKTFKVCPNGIKELTDEIYKQYISSAIPAGESVGLLSSMAIGQLFTQMNLNTFHSAGSKNVSGINAIRELFHITPNKKVYSTLVHFKNKNLNTTEIIRLMKQNLEEVTISKLLKFTEIKETIEPRDKWWYDNYFLFNDTDFKSEIENKRFLRLHLDYVKMLIYNVTLGDIIEHLEDLEQYLVISPVNYGIIDIYVNQDSASNFKEIKHITSDFETVFLNGLINKCLDEILIKGIKNLEDFNVESVDLVKNISAKKQGDTWRLFIDYFSIKLDGLTPQKYIDFVTLFDLTITGTNFTTRPLYIDVSMQTSDIDLEEKTIQNCNSMLQKMSDEQKELYLVNENVTDKNLNSVYDNLKLYVESKDNPMKSINASIGIYKKQIQDYIEELNSEKKRDKKEVIKEHIKTIINHPVYSQSKYNYITAYGKKIIDKLIHQDIIDSKYILPNDVNEIYELFGIESARLFLVREYIKLISKSSFINPANIELLTDFQTSLGFLSQVTHSGVNKQQGSLLSSASFENPMNVFKNASMGKIDPIQGISGCIISGKKCKNGTGIVDVSFDDTIPTASPPIHGGDADDIKLVIDNYNTSQQGEVRDLNYNPNLPNLDSANQKLNSTLPSKKTLEVKPQSQQDVIPTNILDLELDIEEPVSTMVQELDLDIDVGQGEEFDIDDLFNVKSEEETHSIEPPYFQLLCKFNQIYKK